MTQLREKIRALAHACEIVACLVAMPAFAASPVLITHDDPVTLPGVGRILLGFLVTVVLACAIIYGLRRCLPRFVNRYSTSSSRLQMQTTVQNGLKLHIVAVEGQTVLIAEGKTGIAMTPLKSASNTTPSAVP